MDLPRRKLHRLKNWDYSQPSYYHVTICTQNKKNILCQIHQAGLDTVVIPSAAGQCVIDNWNRLHTLYPNIKTDYFCLMPNHIHGIIIIEPSNEQKSLSDIVRGFKSVTTREFNKMVPECKKNTLWQSSFYDEIIKNDSMLFEVRKYIFGNPSKWLEDELYVK